MAEASSQLATPMPAVTVRDEEGTVAPVDPANRHDLLYEDDLAIAPGTRIVSAQEVRDATGHRAEDWRVATEKELLDNCRNRN
eukprot:12891105-Prorocentrum_lima.AAC.1